MNEHAWFWYMVLGIIYLAILYMLVKPGSPAGQGVQAFANAFASLVKTAVGGTNNNSSATQVPGGTLT